GGDKADEIVAVIDAAGQVGIEVRGISRDDRAGDFDHAIADVQAAAVKGYVLQNGAVVDLRRSAVEQNTAAVAVAVCPGVVIGNGHLRKSDGFLIARVCGRPESATEGSPEISGLTFQARVAVMDDIAARIAARSRRAARRAFGKFADADGVSGDGRGDDKQPFIVGVGEGFDARSEGGAASSSVAPRAAVAARAGVRLPCAAAAFAAFSSRAAHGAVAGEDGVSRNRGAVDGEAAAAGAANPAAIGLTAKAAILAVASVSAVCSRCSG